jgi:uncharacterized protein DUF6069
LTVKSIVVASQEVLMSEASAGTGSPSRTALPAGPVWRAGLLAALAATAANVVLWLVLQQLLDAGLQIPVRPNSDELQSLPLVPVVAITLLPALLGVVLLWLLTRRGPAGVGQWTVVAAVFGVLSSLPALGIDVSLARRLGLVLFHLLATAVMIVVVRRQLPASRS